MRSSPALSDRALDSGDDEPRRRLSSSPTVSIEERRPSLRRRHTGQELDRDRDRPSSRKPSTVRDNEEIIKEAFGKYGEVEDVFLPKDRETNKPRGFGFITFRERADAESACDQMHG